MKIGRNDPCPCGSGKKYKKCCIDKGTSKLGLWQNNMELISDDSSDDTKQIFFNILKIIETKHWEGACHATSALMYILFSEVGLDVNLFVGEVQYENAFFDHSWVEVNGKVYDAAICLGLNAVRLSPPIYNDNNIETMEHTSGLYGVVHNGIDPLARVVLDTPVVEYMDGFPSSKNGLWTYIEEIGNRIGMTVDISILKNKYSKSMWKLKKNL